MRLRLLVPIAAAIAVSAGCSAESSLSPQTAAGVASFCEQVREANAAGRVLPKHAKVDAYLEANTNRAVFHDALMDACGDDWLAHRDLQVDDARQKALSERGPASSDFEVKVPVEPLEAPSSGQQSAESSTDRCSALAARLDQGQGWTDGPHSGQLAPQSVADEFYDNCT